MARTGPRVNQIRLEQQRVTGTSNIGEEITAWVKWRDVMASMVDRRGDEHFDEVNQRYAETETRFEVDYSDVDGITEKFRLVHVESGEIYNIKNILRDHIRKESTLIVAVRQV